MKFSLPGILALFLLATVPVTAPSAGEVTATNPAVSTASKWWAIPYPDRFDVSLLSREQAQLSISGKDFVTAAGDTFIFRGVNIGDPDKLDSQGQWTRALFEEIHSWGANTVRLPVHPVAWRERGADWYFARIDEAVLWANALDMYLVIDWHSIGNLQTQQFQHPMYVTSGVETATFWRGIAHRYAEVPTVAVYELFNEPTDNYIGFGSGSLGKADWDGWRDMLESLIDLVRVYDPSAIALVGGFNWAYDLAPVADRPVRRDGVAYAVHVYPQKARPEDGSRQAQFDLWQSQWGWAADRYPLFASEIGWVREDGYGAHVPVIDNSGSYGPQLVEFMEARGISWAVWNFDPDWSPTLIADWSFTPTEQGRFFRDVMQRLRDGSMPLATLPSPRVEEYPWMSMSRWRTMHAEDVDIAAGGGVRLLFLGDSITEGWPADLWSAHFSRYGAANFGIGGDRTENLLWRLRNGSTGRLDPEVVVLMIGVNNFGLRGDSPRDVFLGVQAVVEEAKAAFASARIVLLGILPYGQQADSPGRRDVIETNALLASLADDPRVEFHDIGAAFLQADGSIAPAVMADFLHPTDEGYAIFAGQLDPILAALLE
jgi:lysophospholipase L1-like esterase